MLITFHAKEREPADLELNWALVGLYSLVTLLAQRAARTSAYNIVRAVVSARSAVVCQRGPPPPTLERLIGPTVTLTRFHDNAIFADQALQVTPMDRRAHPSAV